MAGQHMFRSLNDYSTKLSKSQQRHTISALMDDENVSQNLKDASDGGLCASLSLIWIREQIRFHIGKTQFPRLDHKNVVNSKRAYKLTKKAAGMEAARANVDKQVPELCNIIQLKNKEILTNAGKKSKQFSSIADTLNRTRQDGTVNARAFLLTFAVADSSHSVALHIKKDNTVVFYDSNAGSYHVNGVLGTGGVKAFLDDYHQNCLPKKWPNKKLGDELGVWAIS